MNIDLKRGSGRILLLLLMTDMAFILAHLVLHLYHYNTEAPMFMLDVDGGYPEFLGYIKEFWLIVLCLTLAFTRSSKTLYIGWACLFTYFLLDDYIGFHEDVGAYAVELFNIQPVLSFRAQDLGELLVTGVAGAIIFSLIAIGYWLSDAQERKNTHVIFGLVLLLVFFGVVIDMIHGAMPTGRLNGLVAMVEDGGEMIAMSLIVWFVFSLTPATAPVRARASAARKPYITRHRQVAVSMQTVGSAR